MMSIEGTAGLSESLDSQCNMSEKSSTDGSASPDMMKTKPKKQYRPKATSLPTSLVRNIQLEGGPGSCKVITTIILQFFSDRIFLSITQLSGKMGSLLLCNVEESIIDNSTTYNVSTLLGTGVSRGSGGNAEQEISLREVLVRRLAERIVLHARKMAGVGEKTILGGAEDGKGAIPPLVLGLGLRPMKGGGTMSVESFNAIVDVAMELYEEGWQISHAGRMVGMEGPD
ncbi:hypothetical protein ACHAWF_009338 [Thalassiosira exigua]